MLDPRTKIFIVLVSLVLVFTKVTVLWQLVFLCIILSLILSFKKQRKVFSSIRYFLYFVPVTLLIHVLLTSVSIRLNGIRFSFEIGGFLTSLMFTLRILNMFLLMGFAVSWVNSLDFIDSVYSLISPLKKVGVPVDDIFMIIFIGLRFFPVVKREYKIINDGYKTFFRMKPADSIMEKIRELRNSVAPLMISTLRKADNLSCSMKVRGYGVGKRSYFRKLVFTGYDYFAFGLTLLIAGIFWYA